MATDEHRTRLVNEHYGRPDLYAVILAELRKAGVDPAHPTTDDLAPFDQFHSGGKAATLGLVELAGLAHSVTILDVGGGYGGPARSLAEVLDAYVTVLDLTDEFIRTGQKPTEITGLASHVTHKQGDALDLPFGDDSFDVVWSQNATMNIPDKSRLFSEIHRVLRPGGKLAIQDLLAGPIQPIHFPVPWAHDASTSFLRSEPDTRAMLEAAGLRVVTWVSNPTVVTVGGANPSSKAAEIVRPMDSAQMQNARNIEEGRVISAWYVAVKGGA